MIPSTQFYFWTCFGFLLLLPVSAARSTPLAECDRAVISLDCTFTNDHECLWLGRPSNLRGSVGICVPAPNDVLEDEFEDDPILAKEEQVLDQIDQLLIDESDLEESIASDLEQLSEELREELEDAKRMDHFRSEEDDDDQSSLEEFEEDDLEDDDDDDDLEDDDEFNELQEEQFLQEDIFMEPPSMRHFSENSEDELTQVEMERLFGDGDGELDDVLEDEDTESPYDDDIEGWMEYQEEPTECQLQTIEWDCNKASESQEGNDICVWSPIINTCLQGHVDVDI